MQSMVSGFYRFVFEHGIELRIGILFLMWFYLLVPSFNIFPEQLLLATFTVTIIQYA